jgi:hypothetical protein
VFTTTTASTILESIRLDLGYARPYAGMVSGDHDHRVVMPLQGLRY